MLCNATTEKAISLEGHAGAVSTAMFSPDGTRCATGSLDKTVRLWDAATGRPLSILRGHVGGIRQIDYSPNGDRILSAAEDGAALWNVSAFAPHPIEPVSPVPAFAERK